LTLARGMVEGVGVLLIILRRPWEASGTSGMKVLVNGGLILSELDGWWAEAYNPSTGWAIGDGQEHADNALLDAMEAEQLYQLLEKEVIPLYYERDEQGIPRNWIRMIKQSMAQLTPRFSASRTVIEYTEKYYLPGALEVQRRLSQPAENSLATFHKELRESWPNLAIREVHVENGGTDYQITASIHLASLPPQQVQVELFADGINNAVPIRIPMKVTDKRIGKTDTYIYTAQVDARRPWEDYTVRIIPRHESLAVPLECNLIYWQK